MNEKLKELKELELKDIMNTVPQMIWKVIVKDDKIIPIYFNEAWDNYVGKNKNIFDKDIVHPDDYLVSKKAWDLGQKNLIFQTNRRLKDTKGNYNWFLTRAIFKNGYWYGTCTNIKDIEKDIEREKYIEDKREKHIENEREKELEKKEYELSKQKLDEISKEVEILSKQKIEIEKRRINLTKESEKLSKEKIDMEEKRINLSRDLDNLAREKIKVEEKRIEILGQAQILAQDKIYLEKNSIELLFHAESLAKEKIEYENNKIIKESLINKNLEFVKMQQKDEEFLSFISHEIRNPIFAISSMIEFLKNTNLSENQLEFINIQEESCNIILHLVNNILNEKKTGNKTDIQNTVFNINTMMQNVINISKNQIENKSLKLIVELPQEQYNVYGDYFKIYQILLNLINNAIKFTYTGSITVSCKIYDEDDTTCNVTISVKDTGIGIGKDKMDKLFKPFSQTGPDIQQIYGGYGLGLNICQKLITLMNGTINIESEFNKGSTFYINLTMLKALGTF